RPVGKHTIYVCTNISCSLRGADALYDAMLSAAGDDADFNVRAFECLGACDIAPMASVNTVYLGPLKLEDCPKIIEACKTGADPLPEKQLARAPIAETWWASGEHPEGEAPGGAGRDGETKSRPAVGNGTAV
ncbi:MAG: NADH-quinone oxidoreductase subunit, partial [Solirubrobacteraceae bacterium]|nr:NADH-quinone oxidoreductase subunit [Solirubrobacteraceae bacterium]